MVFFWIWSPHHAPDIQWPVPPVSSDQYWQELTSIDKYWPVLTSGRMRLEGFGGLLIYLLIYWLMGNNYWLICLSNSIVPAGTHSGDFLYMGFEIAFHGAHISRSFPVIQVIAVIRWLWKFQNKGTIVHADNFANVMSNGNADETNCFANISRTFDWFW